ncbi:MAG: hypothetical protein F8N36_10020 [Desulfovibrio sp.]|uniref:hypothetical protein n=1 Tax=Desulfovibrio sp. TaxID=885 RepID=UPI00135EC8DF|nr:hypothetical protein [Desulfovibrio sp.]MTJ93184.1 hypothetical protein [Desulfovibrio sp.]
MDKRLPWLFLVLFVALQVLYAPMLACAQEPAASPVAAPAADTGKTKARKQGTRNDTPSKSRRVTGKKKNSAGSGIHAPAWAFDDGTHSREAWREGKSTSDLQKSAVGEEAAKENSVNTASGINSALKSADRKAEPKNGLAVSVGQDESAWRKKSQLEPEGADENIPMQSRHVVRAYADVDAGDNLNIRVGPELILKDEQRERTSANKQPESALGMGMQFKLGF